MADDAIGSTLYDCDMKLMGNALDALRSALSNPALAKFMIDCKGND